MTDETLTVAACQETLTALEAKRAELGRVLIIMGQCPLLGVKQT
jgi:hypothetical protein